MSLFFKQPDVFETFCCPLRDYFSFHSVYYEFSIIFFHIYNKYIHECLLKVLHCILPSTLNITQVLLATAFYVVGDIALRLWRSDPGSCEEKMKRYLSSSKVKQIKYFLLFVQQIQILQCFLWIFHFIEQLRLFWHWNLLLLRCSALALLNWAIKSNRVIAFLNYTLEYMICLLFAQERN